MGLRIRNTQEVLGELGANMGVIVIDLMNPDEEPGPETKKKAEAQESNRELPNPRRRVRKQVININGEIVAI